MEAKDLLKGLEDQRVTIENFSEYLQQTGVIVNPHIGRLRKKFAIPREILGVRKDDEFYSEYVNGSSFSLLSKEDENTFASIETAVRHTVRKMAIGYDKKYMPIGVYKEEYLPYFKDKKEKYFKKRDEIAANWDDRVNTFKAKFSEFLNSRNLSADIISQLTSLVYSEIPTKKEFVDSFYMNVSLSAFPVAKSLSILDESISDEIKDSIARDSLSSLYEILGCLMKDAFKSINTIIAYYNKNGVLSRKYKNVLLELSNRLVKNNILKNSLLDELVSDAKRISKLEDEDDVIESCEIMMSKIYGFSHQIKVEDYLDFTDSELSQATLHTIFLSLSED